MSPYNLPIRPRRLRRTPSIRAMVQETHLRKSDLIAPLFVVDGDGKPESVDTMPGVKRFPIDHLLEECAELQQVGVKTIALFPCIATQHKDAKGNHGLDPDGILYRAVRSLREAFPHLTIITDVALDPYTDHGHDGVLTPCQRDVDNDRTVELLAQMAVLQAQAGADIVAPSDMMDGRVGIIRRALDNSQLEDTAIMAYSAKFASSLYGPFRDAVGSSTAAGTHHLDKRTYQLNPCNCVEAIRDALMDEEEGADILMVKPAGWYLDIIGDLRSETRLPIAAYQISGEYAMIHSAVEKGWLDLAKAREESLVAIKRAGADLILTYFAKEMARCL